LGGCAAWLTSPPVKKKKILTIGLTIGCCSIAGVCRGKLACTQANVVCTYGKVLNRQASCVPAVNCNALTCCVLPSTTTTIAKPTTTAKPTTPTTTVKPTSTSKPQRFGVGKLSISSPPKQPTVKITQYQGVVTVVVQCSRGFKIGGAMVSGQFNRSNGKVVEKVNGQTAATGASVGTITLRTKTAWTTLDKSLQFCVTSISKSGYAYDTQLNKMTCVKL
jgi:hypothetical protein